MLPPLLGLLLDCAKKSDQSVVSMSLGALVHLIEVGGYQFSDHDWDTLLKSIRCTYILFLSLSQHTHTHTHNSSHLQIDGHTPGSRAVFFIIDKLPVSFLH